MKIEKNEISEDFGLNLENHLISTEVICKTSQEINNLSDKFIIVDSKEGKEKNENEKIKKEINQDIIRKQQLFEIKKCYTTIEFKKKRKELFQTKQRKNINNFTKNKINIINNNNQLNKDFMIRNLLPKNEKRYVEYADFYFDDEMFITESSSFPNEKEQDFLQKIQFIEENNYNDDIENFDIRHCSYNYKINQRDEIYIKYFDNEKKDINEKNYLN